MLLQLSPTKDENLPFVEQNPAKAKVTRKFLVAEGIYYNSGDMAPLPRLVSQSVYMFEILQSANNLSGGI